MDCQNTMISIYRHEARKGYIIVEAGGPVYKKPKDKLAWALNLRTEDTGAKSLTPHGDLGLDSSLPPPPKRAAARSAPPRGRSPRPSPAACRGGLSPSTGHLSARSAFARQAGGPKRPANLATNPPWQTLGSRRHAHTHAIEGGQG